MVLTGFQRFSLQGMDVNLKDGDKATPLHFAASRGHLNVVKWLLKRGAKISPDKFGNTPVNDAENNRQNEILRVFEDIVGETTTSDETSLEESEVGPCTCGASSHPDQV